MLPLLVGCAAPLPCNGHPELCERPLDEVVFPATHNAMSNADEGWIAPNQQHPPAVQLADGVRGMLVDTYLWNDGAWLCHSFCEWGATPLVDFFGDLATFFEDEPRDVLVLVVQDDLSPELTEEALIEAGLSGLRLTPPEDGEAWPTLGELAAMGERLLITRESGGRGPDWFPSFYGLGFDTPYDFRSADEFSCDVLRGESDHDLFLLNHWISTPLPDRDAAAQVNAADVLGPRARSCADRWGRLPNLVAVNHHDLGDLFEVVDALNGVDGSDER